MSYTIGKIKLENFAQYANVEVSFDRNVTYLVGGNGSGKSTLGLSGIWFMFQGIAEKSSGGGIMPLVGERFRFIGPASTTAKGEMTLIDDVKGIEINVIRKMTKSGSEVKFEAPEGIELNQQWLNDLFNVFLLSPKRFTELSGREQARVIGIDTSIIDSEFKTLKEEFTLLNRDMRQFDGLTEPERAERVNIFELTAKKRAIDDFNRIQDNRQSVINQKNIELQAKNRECEEVEAEIERLQLKSERLNEEYTKLEADKSMLDVPEEKKSTEEIDRQIAEAGSQNLKAAQYDEYLNRKSAKDRKETEIRENKRKQGETEQKWIDYIQSKKLPFKNLSIDDEANLLFDGKPIKEPYFSTGELIKMVPILLASQDQELKYVFLQDFNLLDEDKQQEVEKYLTDKGFQLVIEYIGREPIADRNCILLKDNQVVSDADDERETINL